MSHGARVGALREHRTDGRGVASSSTLVGAFAALGVLFAGMGCDEEPSVPAVSEPRVVEAAPTEAVVEAPPPTASRRMMRGHFVRAIDARNALIRADLDRARTDMSWLATHDGGGALPDELRPRFAAMQSQAARFDDATTLTEAGTAFARTLVRCGECHTAAETGPRVATPPVPEGDTVEGHMRRHQWAADRMFEGLVTDDAELFLSGTQALSGAPLHADQLPGAATQPLPRLQALTDHVRELAAEAQDASTAEQRAGLYGRYLATCGACHRLLDGGPEAESPVE